MQPQLNVDLAPAATATIVVDHQRAQTCAICLDGHDTVQNQLAVCGKCHVAVHQACYGGSILDRIPHSGWLCDHCRHQSKFPDKRVCCVFCPFADRGPLKHMKIADEGTYFWAHVQCVNWIPELAFVDEEYRSTRGAT